MNTLFLAFERASLFGFVALLVALCAQWMLNGRVPSSWRVWLWRAALLQTALAWVPLAPLQLAILRPVPAALPLVPAQINAPQFPVRVPAPPLVSAPSSEANAPAPTASVPVATAPRVEAVRAPRVLDWRPFILAVYALGLGVQFVALTRSGVRVRRTLRACKPVENADTHAQLREIARRMNIRSKPRLLETQSGAPFLTGVLRPTIVLPRAFLQPHPASELVLSHELAHQKRRDLAWNAPLWLIETVFWFHPLVWTARRFLALETESACDEMVLSSTRVAPKFYGALLLNTMNNSQTPLAVGVNDGFFALKTRLERLNQTPKRPHQAARIAFVAALFLAFGACLPLRFVARAQEDAPVDTAQVVRGTVVDEAGKPLAGATVYAMRSMANGHEPLETTVSDAKGAFQFSPRVRDKWGISTFVDAGERGMGEGYVSLSGKRIRPVTVRVAPGVRAKLLFLDEQRPVPNLEIRLRRVGESENSWMAMPRVVHARMKATTDANGIALFPPLPQGKQAQFVLSDETSKRTRYGSGDLRAGRFAPLSTEGFVRLNGLAPSKTIQLVAPVEITGRVSLPEGGAAGDVLVMARRINAVEAASKSEYAVPGIDQLIAQTRSNAQGKYVLNGLRPGNYWIWVYPEKRLTRDFIGQTFQKTFVATKNTQNFALSRGALVQGVVLSQTTKQPVKGQTMWLFDSQENNQYTITDARGFFKFRALGGKQRLRVHANGQNSPPPGFILPVKSQFDFEIQNGQKREFKIELPGAPIVKPTQGIVVGTDGQPVPNATVQVRVLGGRGQYSLRSARTDAQGRFSVQPRHGVYPLRLWADAGELTTPYGTIAPGGEDVTLQLEADVWASVSGRVQDAQKRPITGVRVQLNSIAGHNATSAPSVVTGADGSFRVAHLRPESRVWINISSPGYERRFEMVQSLKKGEEHVINTLTLRQAKAQLGGLVLESDGKPASNVYLSVAGDGLPGGAHTGANGRFFCPSVVEGPLRVVAYRNRPTLRHWGPFSARGGQKNLVIRLTDDKLEKRTSYKVVKPRIEASSLVGRTAPELRIVSWLNGPAQTLSSLRGKVVVVNFGLFEFNEDSQFNDFARSFGSRGVQTIGVDLNSAAANRTTLRATTALDVPFPLALDAPPATRNEIGGQTYALYGNSQYVVIGRDGKVVYAGNEFDRAIIFAATASK